MRVTKAAKQAQRQWSMQRAGKELSAQEVGPIAIRRRAMQAPSLGQVVEKENNLEAPS